MTQYLQAPEQPVDVTVVLEDRLYMRHAVFAEGTHIPQHSHDQSHISYVATGAVRCWKDGVLLGEFVAPAFIKIEARAKHLFLALRPATTIVCVHALDENGEVPVHEEHHLDIVGV
ncbi:MAG: hypothetical protein JWP57_4362 [Spirosoma sp.]|nr:hypothetical protein [Spirosoma sp.]